MCAHVGQLYDNSAESIEGVVTSEDVDTLQRELDTARLFLARAQELHALELQSHNGMSTIQA